MLGLLWRTSVHFNSRPPHHHWIRARNVLRRIGLASFEARLLGIVLGHSLKSLRSADLWHGGRARRNTSASVLETLHHVAYALELYQD